MGTSVATPDRRLLETDPAYQRKIGYTAEEPFGKPRCAPPRSPWRRDSPSLVDW